MTALPSNAQQFVYSPPQYANVEAPGPAADVTGFPSYRVQHVYDSSVFAGLGSGPFTITRIDWRADGSVNQPQVYPSERWIATMSTTAVTPRTLSRTYADNIGADVQTVVDGPVTLTTQSQGPVGGPKEFDYGFDLETPFVYDPSRGNLLFDLQVINGEGPLLFDFLVTPTDAAAHNWSGSLGVGGDMAEAIFGSNPTRFTIIPEPSGAVLWLVGLVGLLRRNNQRKAL
jgi:hypothetical protein